MKTRFYLPVGYTDNEWPTAIVAGAVAGAFGCSPWGYLGSLIGCFVGGALGWWAGRERRRRADRARGTR